MTTKLEPLTSKGAATEAALAIIDRRTGASYEIAIDDSSVRASDLRQIRTSEEDAGLLSFNPACSNTASCHSAVGYDDGERGILEYHGYRSRPKRTWRLSWRP